MRGTLKRTGHGDLCRGIIPAYAGNTCPRKHPNGLFWDHPRVCGEHTSQFTRFELAEGSSPRMRGTPAPYMVCIIRMGIIPAYAGNTADTAARTTFRRDHPRVCGEHVSRGFPLPCFPGSSPRMRGTHCPPRSRKGRAGIIPAYAGNTMIFFAGLASERDHPRVCGEHFVQDLVPYEAKGSSPRMRGTQLGNLEDQPR